MSDKAERAKYRLKAGVGRHRLKSEVPGQLGKLIEPGDVFEPTDAELKSFGFKFELVSVDAKGAVHTADDNQLEDLRNEIQKWNRNQLKKRIAEEMDKPAHPAKLARIGLLRERLTAVEAKMPRARSTQADKQSEKPQEKETAPVTA